MGANSAVSPTAELSLLNRLALAGLFPVFGKDPLSSSSQPPAREANKETSRSVARWLLTFAFHRNPALHWRQRLALTFLQAQRASFPTHHLRWLVRRVSTGEAVLRYCNDNNISHKTITVDETAFASRLADHGMYVPPPTLLFLMPPAAPQDETSATLFYLHGGGFVNPLRGAAHMPFIMRCAAACRARQVVILEYALAPEHPYPAQLIQSVVTLRHLLEGMQLRPEDLILAGDSAGGQLVGALLAHLVQPSPYAPTVQVSGQFRAALFASPFVRLPPDVGSYESNDGRDYLNRQQVDGFNAAWMGREDEIWANLSGVETSGEVWGKVFGRDSHDGLVHKVLITVGTAEIFLDCCRDFATKHARAETVVVARDTGWQVFEGKRMVLAECEGEVHVQVALDSVVGYDKGLMERAIMTWLTLV